MVLQSTTDDGIHVFREALRESWPYTGPLTRAGSTVVRIQIESTLRRKRFPLSPAPGIYLCILFRQTFACGSKKRIMFPFAPFIYS